MGGLRLFSDEAPAAGDRLELELYLPDSTEVICTVEVVWVEDLPDGAPARFDVGVKFVEVSDETRRKLESVLTVAS